MAKLTREQKIELYKKKKDGHTIPSLSNEYQIGVHNIEYLIRLIDMHGFDILRTDKKQLLFTRIKIENNQ